MGWEWSSYRLGWYQCNGAGDAGGGDDSCDDGDDDGGDDDGGDDDGGDDIANVEWRWG